MTLNSAWGNVSRAVRELCLPAKAFRSLFEILMGLGGGRPAYCEDPASGPVYV